MGRDVLSTRGLLQAADADGSGDVEAAEWTAFLERVGATQGASLEDFDRYRVKAEVLDLDADNDGVVSGEDAHLALERFLGEGDARRSSGWMGFLLASIADADHDGTLLPEEAVVFLDAVGRDPLPWPTVRGWLEAAEALPPPQDPNALTAGIVLVGLDALFDADANGRVTPSDLQRVFTGYDANADGKVTADEMKPKSGRSGNWGVSRAERERAPAMPWQRNLEDALALVEETGKPLLICVNIDGESASDNLAFGRYRDPEFAALADGFVCVLASPDEREPRARDDRGRRLPDRRFGRLLNSEHIDIEPGLYDRYFNGNRVAPRHVGVSPDGEVLFDLFLLTDLSAVDEKLRQHGLPMDARPVRPAAASRSETELLESPDAADRAELERRFVQGDERTRTRLASLALSDARRVQHPELLHLGLRDASLGVRREAAWSLVRFPDRMPSELVTIAWDVARSHSALREPFIGALARAVELADVDERRTFLSQTLAALRVTDASGNADRWRALVAAERGGEWTGDVDRAGRALETIEKALNGREDDPLLWSRLALARMNMARIALLDGGNPSFFCQDAMDACDRALALDPEDGRALGAKAWASYLLSDLETAGELAERALARLDHHAALPLTAEVARVRAQVATRAVYQAMGDAPDAWDPATLRAALDAWELLAVHPTGTESDAQAHLQLLGSVGAFPPQLDVARQALARFPESSELHNWLRFLMLRDHGAEALEALYAEQLDAAREASPASFAWYAGLASLAAAERNVENRRTLEAREAYGRALAHLTASVEAEPDFATSAAHYQATALSGAARLLVEEGVLEPALEMSLEAARLAPESYDAKDALGKSLRDTVQVLKRALRKADGDVERLSKELEALGLSTTAL